MTTESLFELRTAQLYSYARDAGIPDAFLERHEDMLAAFALRVAAGQRNKDRAAIRTWYYDQNPAKPMLFEVLKEV